MKYNHNLLTPFSLALQVASSAYVMIHLSVFLSQMQLSENSQPIWVDFMPTGNDSMSRKTEQGSAIHIKSGVVSHDGV